jgi:hypothetical protein
MSILSRPGGMPQDGQDLDVRDAYATLIGGGLGLRLCTLSLTGASAISSIVKPTDHPLMLARKSSLAVLSP